MFSDSYHGKKQKVSLATKYLLHMVLNLIIVSKKDF